MTNGDRAELAAVSSRVDDSPGWAPISSAPHDRDPAESYQLYQDALTAWRKNPIAKRIIDITTDYCIGDGVSIDSGRPEIAKFLKTWWHHPRNGCDLLLPDLCDELSRAGDLFLTLHLNPHDGLSFLRPVPKDRIERIETAPNDWLTELAFYERRPAGEVRRWLAPAHPEADSAPAIMLHYAVNRPVGALLGESDLATLIPWLLRYSRMLEDRVRLHWAVRAFLWIVTVPSNKVQTKREQYRTPPEAGSVIIKDDAESWQPVTPLLRASDASHDLRAVRRMVQAGSFPPHWMNEPDEMNLATARAMNDPATRHLRRRQRTLRHLLADLGYQSARRAYLAGKLRTRPLREQIEVALPDISREDNSTLASAARDLALAMQTAGTALKRAPNRPYAALLLRLVCKFAGETLSDDQLNAILAGLADDQ